MNGAPGAHPEFLLEEEGGQILGQYQEFMFDFKIY